MSDPDNDDYAEVTTASVVNTPAFPDRPEPEVSMPGETKADAFRRLGKARIGRIIDGLRVLGNLSNRSSYDYTPAQVDYIEQRLTEAVGETMALFRPKEKRKMEIDL